MVAFLWRAHVGRDTRLVARPPSRSARSPRKAASGSARKAAATASQSRRTTSWVKRSALAVLPTARGPTMRMPGSSRRVLTHQRPHSRLPSSRIAECRSAAHHWFRRETSSGGAGASPPSGRWLSRDRPLGIDSVEPLDELIRRHCQLIGHRWSSLSQDCASACARTLPWSDSAGARHLDRPPSPRRAGSGALQSRPAGRARRARRSAPAVERLRPPDVPACVDDRGLCGMRRLRVTCSAHSPQAATPSLGEDNAQLALIVLPSAASSSCPRAPATPIVSGCTHVVSRLSTTAPPTETSLFGAG